MKILVLNSGSSSLKYQLIETDKDRIAADQDLVLARGAVEKIGSPDAIISFASHSGFKSKVSMPVLKHKEAIQSAFDHMTGENGVLKQLDEIEGVGHRIVHGGEHFHQSTLMTEDVVKQIEALVELAPLHNPHNLKGYYASIALLPGAKNVAVFDTSFHQTMRPAAFLYAIPYLHYTQDKLRRYGFHGTSHRYVSYRFAQVHGKSRADYKIISCHLGNGCSVCAIDHGHSVDTSMGLTPLEGLMMGTRPGDLDAGAVMYLVSRAEMGLHEVDVVLNKYSGLYGISGVSNDMRDLVQHSQNGNERATLAIEMFCYRIKKYIGAYLAAMNGADVILFTGGIGENAAPVRAKVCESLDWLGVSIDPAKNAAATGVLADISAPDARIKVWVVPTDEELLIARDTYRAVLDLPQP
jgi:acetate kinase